MEAIKIDSIATSTPSENEVKEKVEKKGGKRIGFNYIILKSLKESKKNDVVKCIYIKSLINFGVCVIKEGTNGDSKDREGRDIQDRLRWQEQLHKQLQKHIRLPRLLGSFEEKGNYYLVLQRVKGKSLYKLLREQAHQFREDLLSGDKAGMRYVDYLLQIVNLLRSLHNNNIVHRDVTATNFMITPSGKVYVIDMELSYSLQTNFPSPPFQLGTFGYMSPQQEATMTPTVREDIFSLGAILFQVWTGISPFKITNTPYNELREKIYNLVPDKEFADIIIACLNPDDKERPDLDEVERVIAHYKDCLHQESKRQFSPSRFADQKQIKDVIQRSIDTLGSPWFADGEKGWFSENKSIPPNPDKKKINKSWYASFNKGAAGILYVLSKAAQTGFDTSATALQVKTALSLIEEKYANRVEVVLPSLHYGSSGIALSLASGLREGLLEPQAEYFDWIRRLLGNSNDKLDLGNGIAGQGLALLSCRHFLMENEMDEQLKNYCDRLLSAQHRDGSWKQKSGKKTKTTPGFTRGAAGMIYFLLEYGLYCQDRAAIEGAHKGLKWLMNVARLQKDTVQWKSSKNKPLYPTWCDGAPGIATSFLKAYTMTGENRYRQFALKALNALPAQAVENNLSQYAGLCGVGEAYIEAWQCLNDEQWLERAGWIAQVVMQLKKEHPEHGPYWLVDHERQPVAEFMTGNSGVLHFLVRYCYPQQVGSYFSSHHTIE